MSNLPPLNTETIWAILNDEVDDATVNQLVWHCLGYRYDEATGSWDTTDVAPEWRNEYPPPNFIDSRPATVKLTRSIPPQNKQLLKEQLGLQVIRWVSLDLGKLVELRLLTGCCYLQQTGEGGERVRSLPQRNRGNLRSLSSD